MRTFKKNQNVKIKKQNMFVQKAKHICILQYIYR